MAVPKNVLRFQVLLYLSLCLDAVSVAFRDRSTDLDVSDGTVFAANIIAAAMLLFFVHLVKLAAVGRKSWPRFVLSGALLLSLMSLTQPGEGSDISFDSLIEVISCGLTGAGLYYAFTGDSRGWFTA